MEAVGCAYLMWVVFHLQNNPYIDDEAEDDDDDDDYNASEVDEASENGDELSDGERADGPDADDEAEDDVESLHLHLETQDGEDTQCKSNCPPTELVLSAVPVCQFRIASRNISETHYCLFTF